nr:immunoglobulin heavy chain junction region [Macaca mulatta]
CARDLVPYYNFWSGYQIYGLDSW